MEFERNDSNGVVTFRMKGHFDTNTSPAVDEQFASTFEAGCRKIIANFEQVEFISSAGLRVLLANTKKLRGNGGDLHICTLNPTAQEVFDISGFSMILKVFETEDDARSAFS
jgi:anti-sigma B factor antagonist